MYSGINVDFYLEDIPAIIEVHGIQHYQPSSFGKSKVDTLVDYCKQLSRDSKLRDILSKFNITYIEIPYDMNKVAIYMEILKYDNNRD